MDSGTEPEEAWGPLGMLWQPDLPMHPRNVGEEESEEAQGTRDMAASLLDCLLTEYLCELCHPHTSAPPDHTLTLVLPRQSSQNCAALPAAQPPCSRSYGHRPSRAVIPQDTVHKDPGPCKLLPTSPLALLTPHLPPRTAPPSGTPYSPSFTHLGAAPTSPTVGPLPWSSTADHSCRKVLW